MSGDMWVSVADPALAERACRMVFGEDETKGPVIATPAPLLKALADWPKEKSDQVVQLGLELPTDFDLEREMGKAEVKAVALRCCRVTVLHAGKVVGYALRTDKLGINAIRMWERMWLAHLRRLRNAH
jgi:hypothetical protein